MLSKLSTYKSSLGNGQASTKDKGTVGHLLNALIKYTPSWDSYVAYAFLNEPYAPPQMKHTRFPIEEDAFPWMKRTPISINSLIKLYNVYQIF